MLTRESTAESEQSYTYTAIQGWHDHLENWNTKNTELPLAAEIYVHSTQLFKEALKHIPSIYYKSATERQLKRALQTLLLWGDQHDVISGELDKILGHSSILQRSTLRTLNSIARVLTERLVPRADGSSKKLAEFCHILCILKEKVLFILTGLPKLKVMDGDNEEDDDDENDDTSEASSYCQSDSFSEIAEDLTTETNNLMDLHPIYESALESKLLFEGEAAADIVESARSPQLRLYIEQIEMRFPGINAELAIYLGEVNYERFLRCSHSRQVAEATIAGKDEFHDLGIGISVHLTTSARNKYAETTMSFRHGNGFHTKVPPIPNDGKNGRPFLCVACGKRVSITDNKAWKQHLFSDLRPYICFEPSCHCLFETFESRADWARHLVLVHGYGEDWPSFRCRLCFEDTGEGEAKVTIHLERHLQDISLAILPNVPEEELDTKKTHSPTPVTDDEPDITIAMKRARNMPAACKARERKAERFEQLEKNIQKLEEERDYWKYRSKNTSLRGCNRCMRLHFKCNNQYGCTNCERLGVVCMADSSIKERDLK